MGVFVVRRLGSGLPRDRPGERGRGLCQAAARPDAPRALSTSERTDPRVRVELQRREADLEFVTRSFAKLLANFTWWVNREDRFGKNVFEGGFLGLDNISVFDRSAPLPTGGYLEQADGTSWMAMFTQNMCEIAVELAIHDKFYVDHAIKFFEHFFWIAAALNQI